MTARGPISPSHRAIRRYYENVAALRDQHVFDEMNVRSAFEMLLADAAKLKGWTLIPELSEKSGGSLVRPDGTIRDANSLPRGHWEAKDTKDDLAAEIKKKASRGYPLNNIIFEDTERGVLYQNKQQVNGEYNLGNPKELVALLNQFFSHVEPDIESFEEAVEEFKERVPELARGLVEKIQQAHRDNARFQTAFDNFFDLCRTALNPNIRVEAVDEMLVQHLLTERLFRTVFSNPEFVKRNAIAAEVEHVIEALVSKSFDRTEFLKGLDRFYVAIESAARYLPDFSEKQHFLNTIYERFFQGYSVKVADTLGIVYTPQEIVNFMCASVAEVLEKDFGKSLASPDVFIIDPCTGTGNFIVNLMRRIPQRDLPRVYREQLFANEVMLLPYYIAALNIEHAYFELTGTYEPFEGLCFVDTLDLAEGSQHALGFMTQKNAERVERQRKAPITVVIGNPPYNMNQQNENDNNKNRKYEIIDRRVAETYAKDSKASSKTALSDPYVKFFRWATDRLQNRDGIVSFVSNNSFVDQHAFDGMRKHFLRDFTRVYHMDLHGNVRRNPKLSGTTHNVFGIQVGVGITLAVRGRSTGVRGTGVSPVAGHGQDGRATSGGTGVSPVENHGLAGHATLKIRHGAYLPHWTREGGTYAVCFRLNDSLPGHVIEAWEFERKDIVKTAQQMSRPLSNQEQERLDQLFSEKVEKYLDEGSGACWLRRHEVAEAVATALKHFDGERYRLIAWCVMPNHVHCVVQPLAAFQLSGILHSWKSFSSKEANRLLGRSGQFWQAEYYDHLIRDEQDFLRQIEYVLTNPSRAGLKEWEWVGSGTSGGTGGGTGVSPVEHGQDAHATLRYFRVPEDWRKEQKLQQLNRLGTVSEVPWAGLTPDPAGLWLVPEHAEEFKAFVPLGSKVAKAADSASPKAIFKIFSGGVKTNRDEVAYDFSRKALAERIQRFIDDYNGEVDRYKRSRGTGVSPVNKHGLEGRATSGVPSIDEFVRYDKIKWSRDLKKALQRGNYAAYDAAKVRTALYRPFTTRWLFFDRVVDEEVYNLPLIYPRPDAESENRLIALTGPASEKPFMAMAAKCLPDFHLVGPGATTQCLPFYGYNEDGTNRRENVTNWALEHFRKHYADDKITKWDIFYYVYAVLHHPEYRSKYAENLKRGLPRIPLAGCHSEDPDALHRETKNPGSAGTEKDPSASPQDDSVRPQDDKEPFWAFAKAGKELAELHINYETIEPYPLKYVETAGSPRRSLNSRPSPRGREWPGGPGEGGHTPQPLSYRVDDKMRLAKDRLSLKVNDTLTLSGIPPETFEYRLGNRSALEWVIDQYQVTEDKHSGIRSDPNRADDPEYIVKLVGRVIRVSLETVRIVQTLPPLQ
ncbi:MAG: type ISP restriction/modification enzyme [Terriglobia bacterium]